ncbi:MAG: hypothetical protein J5610_03300 [Prevotella sp.]|nr:hypothetical protein [Prevotella sp.]
MKKRAFYKGFGCLLVAIGALAILFAILLAVGSCASDVEAGKKNEAQWKEYTAWMEEIQATEDSVTVDSLLATREQPIIRQGGFATAFGFIAAFVIIIIALIPLLTGGLMIHNARREEKEEQDYPQNNHL